MDRNSFTSISALLHAASILALIVAITMMVAIASGNAPDDTLSLWGVVSVLCTISAFVLRETVGRLRAQKRNSDLREKLRNLEETNRLLNLTESKAKVGHWRLNLADNDLYWSPGTFAIHGIDADTPPELESAIEFYHEEDRDIVANAVEESRRTGEEFEFRARLVRPDGEIRHTQSTALVEIGEDGEPQALFGVFCDRTDEEIMQNELREARNKADSMAQTKSAFLAKMSHEIRTPMNGVIGFADLLSRSELTPEQSRYVGLITESGKSLQTLLNDILDLSKIEAGEFQVSESTIEISNLVQRTAQLFEPLAREKSISLDYSVDADLPQFAKLDGLRVRQVLSNLISNSIRFTDRGGISLDVSRSGTEVEFRVVDTGIGIAQDMLEAIFDPFAQDNEKAAKRRGGTGLGLAISRQLAELMGGDLTVTSVPDNGSVFTLTLPLISATPHGWAQKPRTVDPLLDACARCQCRILLAEDYDINQELISDMGKRLGLTFEIVEDGRAAVKAVLSAKEQNNPFSLVLMDIQMPRMNGIEATKAIRCAGISPQELPILALTANAFADDVEMCLAAGMQEHLAKPIELDRLRDAMMNWLKGTEPFSRAPIPCKSEMSRSPVH